MATDVDRLRIIYELDDLPAAKAFRRLREEAERTNAAITGGATGAERKVVDSARRGADEAVRAEREKAGAVRRSTDQAKAAAAERAAADKASAEASKKVAQEKAAAEVAANAAADKAAAAGRYRTRMVGMQVSQIGQQAAATGNLMQAMAIQLPDLALLAGGAGMAMAGAGAALAISLAPALLDAMGKSKSLAEQMKDLEKSTDDMVSAAERAARPIYELRDAFGDLADYIADADRAAAMFARIRAEANLQGAAKSIGKGYRTSDEPPARAWTGSGYVDLPLTDQAQREATLKKMRDDFGASADQAERLKQAIERLNSAKGPQAITRDAGNLQVVLAGVMENAKLSQAQIEQVKDLAAEAGAVRTTAERQVAEAMSETQKVIEKYAGTTRRLEELARERAVAEKFLDEARKSGNAALVTQMNEVLVNLDAQIAKVKELAAESDISFARLIKGAKGFAQALGTGIVTAIEEGDKTAASSGILALIRRRESGGDYNATLDNGRWTGGSQNLVNMSLNEVRELQRRMLSDPENREKYSGKGSSALGAYQIVGTTLESLIKELGLSGDELFSREMQDRMAQQLLRRRRTQGKTGLRQEWTSLQGVADPVLDAAMGQQSIPRVDPEVEKAQEKAQSERQRELERETQERNRQLEQVKQYGEQLASSLLTQQQTVQLEQKRAAAIQQINASDMSGPDKASAIAAVNAEMQKQITIMALMEEAKRREVDLDALMIGSTMTYRQAIEALGETKRQSVIADEASQAATDKLKESQEFYAQRTEALQEGLADAIFTSKNFGEALKKLAAQFLITGARAQFMAGAFGKGPLAQGGGGLFGNLFSGMFGGGRVAGSDVLSQALRGAVGFRANGGPVSAGQAYVVGERRPELFVPNVSGTIIPRLPSMAQIAPARGAGGGTVTMTIDVRGASGNTEIQQMVALGVKRGMDQVRQEIPGLVDNYDKRGP